MKTALLALISTFVFSNAAIAGKFKPVKSDDWPETAESAESSSDGSDGDEGGGRSPASMPSSGGQLPAIKMLPDGSIDPQSMKDYTP